jgi:hypothetical protein
MSLVFPGAGRGGVALHRRHGGLADRHPRPWRVCGRRWFDPPGGLLPGDARRAGRGASGLAGPCADPAATRARPPLELPTVRAGAYVRAIVAGEARQVAGARTGTRHRTLLKASRTLGRLVGGGELAEDDAWRALLDAAAGHVGVDGCTPAEVRRTIGDGLAFGKRLPRRITRDPPSVSQAANGSRWAGRVSPGRAAPPAPADLVVKVMAVWFDLRTAGGGDHYPRGPGQRQSAAAARCARSRPR